MKKLFSMLLIVVMVFSLASCGGVDANPPDNGGTTTPDNTTPDNTTPDGTTPDDTTPDDTTPDSNIPTQQTFADLRVVSEDEFVLGFLHQTLDSETIKRQTRQVQIEADHYGWQLQEAIYNTPEEIRNGFQALLTQDVDAIVIYNTSPQQYADLIIEARNKGIGVYNIDSELTTGCVANSCMPNGTAAAELAYMLGEMFLWDANYAMTTIPAYQVHMERTETAKAVWDQYPEMNMKAYENVSLGGSTSAQQQIYDYATSFFQQFGNDLDFIYSSWDGASAMCAEAAKAAGNTKCIFVGIDGGSEAFSHIRNGTVYATYSQTCEKYAHEIMSLIRQLQIDGLKPGDAGCSISAFGETIYSMGTITTKDNVPAPGEPIHAAFDYYDENDTNAWYMWDDGQGRYIVE